MTDKLRDAAQQVEREAFEAKWTTPTNCTWTGNGYCSTEYHAWSAESHALRWEGWKARAALAQQDAQAVPTQRQYEMALRQWDHWKSYALELQAKLVKYEGGSPMVLNAAPTPPAQPELQRLTRDDTEHGVEYYRADAVDRIMAAQQDAQAAEHAETVRMPWAGWIGKQLSAYRAQR